MSTLNVYSYYDATGVRKYADFNDVIFTGTWASTGTYLVSAMQIVDYGNSQYYAIVDSVNKNPTTQPTRWQPIRYWSPFILVSQGGGGTNTDETLQIAISGSNTAILAYGYARAAQSSADAAMEVAIQAYGMASTGTHTANTALGIANEALSIAVTGTNAVVAEQGTRSSQDQFLQNQIYVEAGTRSEADQNLLNRVYTEQGTRSSADQFLQNQIYVEAGTRSSADQLLQNQIYIEQGTRSSQDQTLLNMIYAEQGTRSTADQSLLNLVILMSGSSSGSLSFLVAAEAGTRSEADQVLLNMVYTEQGTRSEADQFLQNQIYVEAGTRSSADQTLLNMIYAEQGTRSEAVQSLQTSWLVETGTRSEADQFLQNQIYAEQGTRSEADQTLLNLITVLSGSVNGSTYDMLIAEQGTRSSQDQFLQNQIYVEAGTRSEADQTLLNMIYAEQGTRSTADQSLLNLVTILSGSVNGSTYDLLIAEQGTRSEADQFLQNQIYVEAGTRSEADQSLLNLVILMSGSSSGSLSFLVAAEAGTRSEADQSLLNRIYAEQGTRSEADQFLQNQIYVEQGTRSEAVQVLLNMSYAEAGTRSEADQFLQNQIYVEAGTRSEADQALLNLVTVLSGSVNGSAYGMILIEQGTRSEADQFLQNQIYVEQGTRSSQDQTLLNLIVALSGSVNGSATGLIIAEAGTRSEADQFLQNQIYVEQGTRSEADQSLLNLVFLMSGSSSGSLSFLVAAEAGTRSEADQFLQNQIYVEQGTRSEVAQSLQTSVTAETGTRSEADQFLQNQIYVEAGTRSEADQFLQNQIYVEAGTRSEADQFLQNQIYVEAGTRSEADQFLQNQIYAEQGTRSEADQSLLNLVILMSGSSSGSLSFLVAAEAGTRSEADQSLLNRIYAEQGTRSEADQFLQNQIYAEQGTRSEADQSLLNLIYAEQGTRSEADQFLQNQVYVVESTANSAYALAQIGTVIPALSTLPDVSIPAPSSNQVLLFDGSKWTASAVPTAVAPGAFTYYLDDVASGTLGYNTLKTAPASGTEVQDTVAIVSGVLVPIEGYLSSYINRTTLDAGLWEFNTYASVSNAGRPANIVYDVYTANVSGTQRYLFSGTSPSIAATSAQLYSSISANGSFTVSLTDKLLVKYSALRVGSAVNVTLYHNGSEHYSHIHTPIGYAHNDLGGLQGGSSSANQFYHITQTQSEALVGNGGIPSASNPFVTLQGIPSSGTNVPAVLDWVPAFVGGVVQGPDIQSFTKTTPDDVTWGNYFKSTVGYLGGVECSFMVASVSPSPYGYFGLTADPSTFTASTDSYYWSISNTGYLGTTVALVGGANYGTITTADVMKITYDGAYVKFWVNDRLFRTVARTTSTAKLYVIGVMRNNDGSKYRAVNFKQSEAAVAHTYADKSAPKKWTPIFVGGVTYRYDANSYWKYPGVADWTGQVYSTEGYTRSAYCSAKALVTGQSIMWGLCSTPTSSTDWREIDYCFQNGSDGNIYINEKGTGIGSTYGTWNLTTRFDITYDGVNVKYFVNGVVVRTVARAVGAALYFNGCFFSVATQGLVDVDFGQILTPTVYTADQAYALAVTGTNSIITEQGTRSQADQALLNLINSMTSTVVGLTGTNYWWLSSVSGGPDNIQVTVVNGIVTSVTEMPICYEDFERYGTGAAGTNSLNLGSFWNGAAYINLESVGAPMSEERYSSYATGSVYTLLQTAGTGWAANGTTAMSPVIGYAGSDHFQSYLVGTIFSGTLPDNGDYWSGTTTIYTRAS